MLKGSEDEIIGRCELVSIRKMALFIFGWARIKKSVHILGIYFGVGQRTDCLIQKTLFLTYFRGDLPMNCADGQY